MPYPMAARDLVRQLGRCGIERVRHTTDPMSELRTRVVLLGTDTPLAEAGHNLIRVRSGPIDAIGCP